MTITADNCGGVKFWRFDPSPPKLSSEAATSPQLTRLSLDAEVLSLILHRDSGLMCASLADLSLVVLDLDSRSVARRFPSAHSATITDVAFSADSRWVVSASLDRCVKVWDVPTGHLVDRFRFARPVTTLSLSPTGEYLATGHAGELGVYLWTNVSLYQHVPLKAIEEKEGDAVPEVHMPLTTVNAAQKSSDDKESENDDAAMEVDESLDDDESYTSPAQLSDELVTLANLPESRWGNLLNLDVIKSRNKPKNPVQKPKDAPFFLPTISGLETKFDLDVKKEEEAPEDNTTASAFSMDMTKFGKDLMAAESDEQLCSALADLRDKGPSAVELEIRSLSPDWGGSSELCRQFLSATAALLRSRTNFEAAEAHLGLFLKLHADLFVGGGNEGLEAALEEVSEAHDAATSDLNKDLVAAASLAAFCRNTLL